MHDTIAGLVASYGYVVLFIIVALESFGIPLPGETALVTAAAVAALGRLVIALVIVTAMSAGDAVRAAELLHVKTSIAIHFGTFQQGDDGENEPVDSLSRALATAPGVNVLALLNGQWRWIPPAPCAHASSDCPQPGGRRRDERRHDR